MPDAARVVAPKGKATIEHSRKLKESLEKAFEESSSVVVDLAQLTSIDLTAIHLLYAAKRHSVQANKQFHLAGDIAAEVAETFIVGGFTKKAVSTGAELEERLVDFAGMVDG